MRQSSDFFLGDSWTLRCPDRGIELPFELPGEVHSALLKAGLIPDPFDKENEKEIRWVGRESWEIERVFRVPDSLFRCPFLFLNWARVDTFASVFLNGRKILQTGNHFREYRTEVKKHLKPGENRIRICFRPAEREALRRARKQPFPVPWSSNMTVPHLNLIRKPQCHAGWDWGPALMAQGIYEEPVLSGNSGFRIESVTHRQTPQIRSARKSPRLRQRGERAEEHNPDFVRITFNIEVSSLVSQKKTFFLSFAGREFREEMELLPGTNIRRQTLSVENPRRWWPNGYGEPYLYPLIVRVGEGEVRQKIGIRDLKWNTKKDRNGVSMTCEVNGIPVFCKGANWIPADAFPQEQTYEKTEALLESARKAHMNMIRVWGGGQYEKDFSTTFAMKRACSSFMISCLPAPSILRMKRSSKRCGKKCASRLNGCLPGPLWPCGAETMKSSAR